MTPTDYARQALERARCTDGRIRYLGFRIATDRLSASHHLRELILDHVELAKRGVLPTEAAMLRNATGGALGALRHLNATIAEAHAVAAAIAAGRDLVAEYRAAQEAVPRV